MHAIRAWLGAIPALLSVATGVTAQSEPALREPIERVYAAPGGTPLKAYVFSPDKPDRGRQSAAIVLLHGGGWMMGEPQWTFSRARHFVDRGMVAIAAQYRLSDEKTVTPVEAMEDVCAVIRWMRGHADSLSIDPKRIAAYGLSAGGHLAAAAAIFDTVVSGERVSASPNALVLVSPAVSLASDRWVQHLLGKRKSARDISPDEHVRKGLPPTLILQGDVDTVTPLSGAKRFCERMRAAGNTCELQVYEGFGHMFTPAGTPDDGMPKPDPAISADALARADRFLESLGFLK